MEREGNGRGSAAGRRNRQQRGLIEASLHRQRQSWDVRGWSAWLEETFPELGADYNRAAQYLEAAERGMVGTTAALIHARFPFAGAVPDLIIDSSMEPFPSAYAYGGRVFVALGYLRELSRFQPDEWIHKTVSDGVAIKATAAQIAELVGVEEAFHAIDHRQGPAGVSEQEILAMSYDSLATYDALEHEFRALRMQIRYSLDHGFDRETVESLAGRAARAHKIRRMQHGEAELG